MRCDNTEDNFHNLRNWLAERATHRVKSILDLTDTITSRPGVKGRSLIELPCVGISTVRILYDGQYHFLGSGARDVIKVNVWMILTVSILVLAAVRYRSTRLLRRLTITT